MFAILPTVATRDARPRIPLRWHLAEEDDEGTLFPDETAVTRHVGTGEFRGMEFLHVNARSIINSVPAASRMSFRYTINPYRGCSHACSYCVGSETPILMGDGTTKPMVDVRKGDLVYGTVRRGDYRRYAITEVLDHWSTVKPAYRTTLDDGTQLITSGDHRFLSDRGWKHVTGTGYAVEQRPHLVTGNELLAVDVAAVRERSVEGDLVEPTRRAGVMSVEPLGMELPLYDMTTGTGDFVSDGVISHNCFARPTHDYLGLNIGEDFERRIVVKVNTVERLRAELRSAKWAGEHIAMGTNTDPYQLAEGKYHLTQGVVRTLTDARNPFSILTKSTLILRDLDLLVSAARRTSVHLNFSIGTLDRDVWKLTEPGTPPPERRLTAVRRFNDAGIPCGVLVAPVLPGLSDGDEQVREVVEACVDAGAISVAAIPLHLRPGVREHFMGWLATARPDLVPLYERRFRRGSYQPKAEQARLTALVAGVLKKKGTGTRQVRRYIEDLDDPAGGGPSDASGDDIAGRGTAASETGAVTGSAAARAAARSAPTRPAAARAAGRPAGEQLRLL
jgi:DNA repair photolyase